ncbi:MAG: hypothetical protein H6685_03810 [Deltaproteobacteria bacterium]|nr:hypothetical protein [Deltaproteobacteria bacterium]
MSIHLCLRRVWRQMHESASEPNYVHALFSDALENVATDWARYLFPFKINYEAVFVHKSPIVEFSYGVPKKEKSDKVCPPQRCEIGDLLWCHFHYQQDGTVTRRAVLYQAKLKKEFNEEILSPVIADDLVQFLLYAHWPKFKYIKGLSGTRNIRQGKDKFYLPRNGTKYLYLIRPIIRSYFQYEYGGPSSAATYLASDPLRLTGSLSVDLVESLLGFTGDRFKSYPETMRDKDIGWSRVVWDLLKRAYHLKYTLVSSGVEKEERGRTFGTKPSFYSSSSKSRAWSEVGQAMEQSDDNFFNLQSEGNGNDGSDGEDANRAVAVIVFETSAD